MLFTNFVILLLMIFFSDLGGFEEYLVIHVTSFDLHCSKFYCAVLSHSVMSNSLRPHGL